MAMLLEKGSVGRKKLPELAFRHSHSYAFTQTGFRLVTIVYFDIAAQATMREPLAALRVGCAREKSALGQT
jgi:hypothetical protein